MMQTADPVLLELLQRQQQLQQPAASAAKLALPAKKVELQQEWFVCPDWVGTPAKGVHLEVIKGGRVEDRIVIDKLAYYMVGKNGNVVDIPMEHGSISRVHCVFVHHRKGSVYVIDLGSNNGVTINGQRIPSKQTVKITESDEVKIGASSRIFRLNRSAPLALETKAMQPKRPAPSAADAGGPKAKRARTDKPSSVTAFHILLKHSACRNPKSWRDPKAPVGRSPEQAAGQLASLRAKLLQVCPSGQERGLGV